MMQEKLLKHFFGREAPRGDLSREQWETVLSYVRTQRQRRPFWGFFQLFSSRRQSQYDGRDRRPSMSSPPQARRQWPSIGQPPVPSARPNGIGSGASLAWTAVGTLLIAATLAAMGFALAVLVISDRQDEVPAAQPDATVTPTPITPTASPVPAVEVAAQSNQSVIAPTATHTPVPTVTPMRQSATTATHAPLPTVIPTRQPVVTPATEPTSIPQRLCNQAAAQPVTPHQESVIADWHETLWPKMREFAAYAPEAFKEYTQRYDYYSGRHRPFITLALCDEALALQLLGMPFLGEDIGDGLDGDVLAALARLTDSDVGDVDDLLLNPLLEDGITEFDRVAVLLLVLEHERPHAAVMIRRVPWVQEIMREAGLSANDGPSEISFQYARRPVHYYSLSSLVEMAYSSPESLRALLERPWMQDQQVQTEQWLTDSDRNVESFIQRVVVFVRHIAGKSDHGMASILRMPFLQTLEPDDADILDILWETSDAGANYTDGETPLRELLSDPALEGGITDGKSGEVALADLRVRNTALSSELESLSWIRDGVSPSENSGIVSLWKLEHLGSDVFLSVVRQPWVADGLTTRESSNIRSFEQRVIAERNSKALQD